MPNIQESKVKHKVARSFAAMSRGWVACNLALWVSIVCSMLGGSDGIGSLVAMIALTAMGSAIVIFVAWAIIFLPVDLMVPEDSALREPWPAAVCGALAVPALYAATTLSHALFRGQFHVFQEAIGFLFSYQALGLMFLPMICGLTAALTLVRRHPRIQPTRY